MNIDYSTVFSLAPFVNENIVTIIGICLLIGAMAKSSQVGLHVWLPMAMEGIKYSLNIVKSPSEMDLEELLKWLEYLLSLAYECDIRYFISLALLALIAYIIGEIIRRFSYTTDELEMHLVATTIRINGGFRKAIIDLKDPSGRLLKLLYASNNIVSSLVVSTPLLVEGTYTCIHSFVDINIHTSYYIELQTAWPTYILTTFATPNRILWFILTRYFHLKVYTGYEGYVRRIYASPLNYIIVGSLEDIYLGSCIPVVR